jgi:hypothetical protein
MVGWMESANPLFVSALAAVFGGARVCQRVQAGRMPQKGGIGQLESSAGLSRRGHPGASLALWSRKGAGPDHWFGIQHFTPSFEELRERIGKSRLQRKGESESDSFLGASARISTAPKPHWVRLLRTSQVDFEPDEASGFTVRSQGHGHSGAIAHGLEQFCPSFFMLLLVTSSIGFNCCGPVFRKAHSAARELWSSAIGPRLLIPGLVN